MKAIQQLIFLPLFFLLSQAALSQYKGGIGSGSIVSVSSNQPLGRNIFLGGTDDGVTVAIASNQPLGRNIFLGGVDDGVTLSIASNQPLGRNIFLGGNEDGVAVSTGVGQPLGRNIFLGGDDDGVAVSSGSSQQLGRNIFLGGSNDGWAMAMGVAQGSVLPVTLTEFAGQWKNNDAELRWKTSSESNTSHFELERSLDAVNFTSFVSITAAGQSTTEKRYQYLDSNRKNLLPANVTTVYYRLRTVDKDGKISYSGVAALRVDKNGLIQYSLYPNPAKDYFTVTMTATSSFNNIIILLTDASGRLLMRQQMASNQQRVDVAALTNGTYFIQLVDNNKILYTQKIIIRK